MELVHPPESTHQFSTLKNGPGLIHGSRTKLPTHQFSGRFCGYMIYMLVSGRVESYRKSIRNSLELLVLGAFVRFFGGSSGEVHRVL